MTEPKVFDLFRHDLVERLDLGAIGVQLPPRTYSSHPLSPFPHRPPSVIVLHRSPPHPRFPHYEEVLNVTRHYGVIDFVFVAKRHDRAVQQQTQNQ